MSCPPAFMLQQQDKKNDPNSKQNKQNRKDSGDSKRPESTSGKPPSRHNYGQRNRHMRANGGDTPATGDDSMMLRQPQDRSRRNFHAKTESVNKQKGGNFHSKADAGRQAPGGVKKGENAPAPKTKHPQTQVSNMQTTAAHKGGKEGNHERKEMGPMGDSAGKGSQPAVTSAPSVSRKQRQHKGKKGGWGKAVPDARPPQPPGV